MSSQKCFEWEISNMNDVTSFVLDASIQELCKSELEIILSETAERILRIIGMQMNTEKKWVEQIDIEKMIGIYKAVFTKHFPVTMKEMRYLENFLFKKEIFPKVNQILSKVSLQQSDNNKEFIRDSLEDGNGKYDVTNLLANIQDTLAWYPFVMDIDLAEWEKIEYLDTITWIGILYYYMDVSGKNKLFLIKEDKKIILLREDFEQKPKNLGNGLILWVKKWISDTENTLDMGSPLLASLNAIDKPSYSLNGTIYRFNTQSNDLEQIYNKDWLVSIHILDTEYNFFQTTNELWKKWILKVIETNSEQWKISEILQELYDNIYMWPNGFFITERDDDIIKSDVTSDNRVTWNIIIWIHMETWNDNVWPQEKLTGKTLLWVLGTWWKLDWSQIQGYSGFNQVKFYDGNICGVRTIKWYNYFILKKDQQTITPIKWLQWVGTSLKEDFFSGVPSLVKENWKSFVKVFDWETNTARDLIEIQSKKFPDSLDINKWNVIILSFYPKLTVYSYFYRWKLYAIKRWFEVIDWDIYKNRLFRSSEDLNICLYNETFEKVERFLEEVKTPTEIKIY